MTETVYLWSGEAGHIGHIMRPGSGADPRRITARSYPTWCGEWFSEYGSRTLSRPPRLCRDCQSQQSESRRIPDAEKLRRWNQGEAIRG